MSHSSAFPFRTWTAVAIFVLCSGLWLGSGAAAQQATPSSETVQPPATGQWVLPGGCLFSCATWRRGDALLEQGFWSSVSLPGSGLLSISDRSFSLEWHRDGYISRFTLTGPCSYRLWADGRFEPTCGGEVAKSGNAQGSQLVSGSRVAATRDTRYRAVYTAGGALCLRLLEGEAEVRDLATNDPPIVIHEGQGFCFDKPGSAGDSKTNPSTPQKKGDNVMDGKEIKAQYKTLRQYNSANSVRGIPPMEDLRNLTLELPRLSSAQAGAMALALARAHPNSPEAARAIYIAWLQASGLGDEATVNTLQTALEKEYATSYWTSVIGAARAAP